MLHGFHKLDVWKKAHALALTAQRVAAKTRGPGSAPLRNQLVRAAISVPSNIVEGSSKSSDAEFARFVTIAIGSCSELEYHILFAHDAGMMSQSDYQSMLDQIVDVRKMLSGLRKTLKSCALPVRSH